MKCGGSIMLLCVALAFVAEASILKENKRVSPSLIPESNKEFLKDYAGDKRPKVDVLHFSHPFPVVQDSEDFDKDFVQDENKDNGEWKAQTEYDRLRHKLANLKKEAAEALAKKKAEKQELEAAMQKKDQVLSKDQVDIAKKSKEVIPEPVKPDMPTKPLKPVKPVADSPPVPTLAPAKKEPKAAEPKTNTVAEAEPSSSWAWSWPWSWSWPEAPKEKVDKAEDTVKEAPAGLTTKETTTLAPKPKLEAVDTSEAVTQVIKHSIAEKAVQEAKKSLEKCKDELAEAKAQLKKAMAELEEAKLKQGEARAKVKEAEVLEGQAEKYEAKTHSKYTKEAKESSDADAAYSKQKAKTENLRKELEAAAAKVRAMRNAEDKDGGVYPSPTGPTKSAASSISSVQLLAVVVAVVVGHHMA